MALNEKDITKTSTTGNITHVKFGTSIDSESTSTKKDTKYFNYDNVEFIELFNSYYGLDSNRIGNDKNIKVKYVKNGGEMMSDVNWQEKYLDNLDNSIKEIKDGLVNTENRISDTISKYIEYSTHLDKQRHEELINVNNKIDDSIDKINNKIDNTNKWIIGLVITTILSIAAMVVTIVLSN